MRHKTVIPLLMVLFIALQSCETYRVTPLTGKSYPATDPADVELFINNKPTKEYTEIGTVSVRTINSYGVVATTRKPEKANELMREKAASIGGHAVIDYKEENQQIKGTVIRYTE